MIRKFASTFGDLDVIEAQTARIGQGLMKDAHRHEFQYDPQPGMLYVRSRAISSRCNDNFDQFPAEEIKKAYSTFVGKPVFVNHHNADHRRMRGMVIDAVLHEDKNPDGSDDTWVEVLMEVDAIKYPKLAEAVIKRDIERTSMGCDVAYSKCSVCGNKAVSPTQYCAHLKRMKGQTYMRRNAATGAQEPVLVSEICYGLGFFENSLLVEEPADPTAFTWGVDTRGLEAAGISLAASKTAEVIAEDDVGVYLDKLAGVVNDLTKADNNREVADLCDITVPGSSLFCGENKGIPRDQMPQLADGPIDLGDEFVAWLDSKHGIKVVQGTTPAASLKATQNQLNAKKVAGIYQALKTGANSIGLNSPIFTSRDDYILDGHHRWAAKVAYDTIDDQMGDVIMQTREVQADVMTALKLANEFADDHHMARQTVTSSMRRTASLTGLTWKPDNLVPTSKIALKDGYTFVVWPRERTAMWDGSDATYRWAVSRTGEPGATFHSALASSEADAMAQAEGWAPARTAAMGVATVDIMSSGGSHSHAGADGKSFCGAPATTTGSATPIQAFTQATCPRCRTEVRKKMPKLSSYRVQADADTFDITPTLVADLKVGDQVNIEGTYNEEDGDDPEDWGLGDGFGTTLTITDKRYNKAPGDYMPSLVSLTFDDGRTMTIHREERLDKVGSKEKPESKGAYDDHMNQPAWKRGLQGIIDTLTVGSKTAVEMHPIGTKVRVTTENGGMAEGVLLAPLPTVPYPVTPASYHQVKLDTSESTGHPGALDIDFARVKTIEKIALGEQKAPPEVDTLREETCPVCGETDAYSGDRCSICGFVKPPDEFMDPDLEVAKNVDLRDEKKDQAEDAGAPAAPKDLKCDSCGAEHSSGKADATAPAAGGSSLKDFKVGSLSTTALADGWEKVDHHNYRRTDGRASVSKEHGTWNFHTNRPNSLEIDRSGSGESHHDAIQFAEKALSKKSMGENYGSPPVSEGGTCPTCNAGTLTAIEPVGEAASPPEGATDGEEQLAPEPEAAESDDDESEDEDPTNEPLKDDSKRQKESMIMARPALQALAEQQAVIETQGKALAHLYTAAGLDISPFQQEARQRVASLRVKADGENPAQPVPTPGAEAPSETTQDTVGDLNDEKVTAPGGVNANEGVAPDATTSVTENSGPVLDEPLNLNDYDPTKPVAGTTEQRPLSETKIETDVQVGGGDNSSTMFPLEGGPFANRATTGSVAEPRLYASQRLARLQMQAGIAPEQDDLILAQAIAKDASMTDEKIAAEVKTLSAVLQAKASQAKTASRALVPQAPDGLRTTPSFASTTPETAGSGIGVTGSMAVDADAEIMW